MIHNPICEVSRELPSINLDVNEPTFFTTGSYNHSNQLEQESCYHSNQLESCIDSLQSNDSALYMCDLENNNVTSGDDQIISAEYTSEVQSNNTQNHKDVVELKGMQEFVATNMYLNNRSNHSSNISNCSNYGSNSNRSNHGSYGNHSNQSNHGKHSLFVDTVVEHIVEIQSLKCAEKETTF